MNPSIHTAPRPIDIGVFYDMCPAILFQLLTGDCNVRDPTSSTQAPVEPTRRPMEKTTQSTNASFTAPISYNQTLENIEQISDLKRKMFS